MKVLIKTLYKESTRIKELVFERYLKDFVLISIGITMATIGLKQFLLPNDFLDGGAMGLSLLTERATGVDLSLLIVLINLPFIFIGAKQISWEFAFKSMGAILALSLLVHFVDFKVITSDKLLISVFGGFFLGAGIGFTIRGGAVIDGTEVLAIYVSKKTSLTVGDFISVFNIGVFACAAFLFNVETAMYSMLTYFSASKTVDFIINGIEEYIGVTIVSRNADEIKQAIIDKLQHGVTVYNSESGYGKRGIDHNENKVLYCVVTRLEVTKLVLEIQKVDEGAFIVQHSIKDTKGGMIKKRPLH
ncbi:YitT family protein [Flavobacterium stagni]|uniref:YitT family protein n=1 Tax=Flavobacterium stagni TaxID=2506421 RepID=A0A4Q1KAH5_9FLAO|nr:YitT family protein [Flavobacterium stagni]RXR23265.1 YitT family protein [Flavobacterium stagni]